MNRKALDTLEEYGMIAQGDRVCVALSGGADSVALLSFLREMGESLGITLTACHLNHRLRGAESDGDEAFVRRLCRDWGIPLTVASADVAALAKERGLSLEECGREERYRLFERMCGDGGKVATAHTLTDSMETVLLSLTRGTGLRGMMGIPPVRGRIIRPLIRCTRQEIEAHCRERGLAYVTDSSNLSQDYARNRLRHRVLPILYELNPAAHQAFLRMMTAAGEAQGLIEGLAQSAQTALWEEEGYSVEGFLRLERPVQQALLAGLCRALGGSLSQRHLEICLSLLQTGGAVEVGKGLVFTVRGGAFTLCQVEKPTPVEDFSVELPGFPRVGGSVFLSKLGKTLRWEPITCEQSNNFPQDEKLCLKNSWEYGKMYGIVVLRSRRPGDSFHSPGRGCGKTLKKLFAEAAVPREERGRRLVLADEAGVLWVEGFGWDERMVKGGAAPVVLEIREEENP